MTMTWKKTPPPMMPVFVSGDSLRDHSVSSSALPADLKVSGTMTLSSGLSISGRRMIDSDGAWLGEPGGVDGDVGENADDGQTYFGKLRALTASEALALPNLKEGLMVFLTDQLRVAVYDGTNFV